MKKKQIEKIPWLAKGNGKKTIVKAEIVGLGGENILIVDLAKGVPVIRICLTEKDYASYIPEGSPMISLYGMPVPKWTRNQIDNMGLYMYIGDEKNYSIDERTKEIISEFTGCPKTFWRNCIRYKMSEIHDEECARREERRIHNINKRMATVPKVPKTFEAWAKRFVDMHHITILPFGKKKATKGICSACGEKTEYARGEIKAGARAVCSHCNAVAVVKRTDWENRNPLPVHAYKKTVLLLQKTEEGFVQRHFEVWKDVAHNEEFGGIGEYGRIFRIDGKTFTYYHKWNDFNYKTFWDDRNLFGMNSIVLRNGPLFSRNVTKKAFDNSQYRYSGLEAMKDYPGFSPIEYLEKYDKLPQIEIMAKIGLHRLALEIQEDDIGQGAKPWEKLGISKIQLNRMIAIDGGLLALEWMEYEKEHGRSIEDKIIQWFQKERICPNRIQFVCDRMSEQQIANYIRRQMEEGKEKCFDILSMWEDYLAMAERLGIDTMDPIVYRVRKLRQRHDELVEQIGDKNSAKFVAEMAKKFPNVDSNCGKIKEKYEYVDDEYAIVAPDRIEDIVREGNKLQHCINKSEIYFDRINSNESYILFLRRKEDIEKPWYTLEIEPDGTVRQKRTEYDRQKPDLKEAQVFIRKWQSKIRYRLSKEDKEMAKKSKMLRMENFEDLRLKGVKIRHGDLIGQYLADVLEADLMEADEKSLEGKAG